MIDAKRIRCSMARKKGTRIEYELLKALKDTYPSLAHTFIKGEYHALYDIYTPFCNLDMVSVDTKHRIITDHKKYCKSHIKHQKETGIPGFIVFIWDNKYKYLPVDARKLRRVKRPTIDGYLLNACKPLPIDSLFCRSNISTCAVESYISLHTTETTIKTVSNDEKAPIKKPCDVNLPIPKIKTHNKCYREYIHRPMTVY